MSKFKIDKKTSNKIGTILLVASLIPFGISAKGFLDYYENRIKKYMN